MAVTHAARGQVAHHEEVTGWVGWSMFAGVMMFMAGAFHSVIGLIALLKDEVIVGNAGNLVVFDIDGWGWSHLVFGALLILASASVLSGQMFGRVVGVLLALSSAVVSLAMVPAYPIWSIVVITVDMLVIYALIVHGRELDPEH